MFLKLLLVVTCCSYYVTAEEVINKRQVSTISEKDPDVSETAFPGAAVHAGSKYFQYAHVPAKNHYEHGHRRGNDHHFIERHEKGQPHDGQFKSKVRWGDKHGGYGEHYWDYNHAGHGGDDGGEESQQNTQYAPYQEEEHESTASSKYVVSPRNKRDPGASADVEFINDRAKSLILSGKSRRHGGNYKSIQDSERGKREQTKQIKGKNLVFDSRTGIITDSESGIEYNLSPIEY